MDYADELDKLHRLKENGTLTEEEFAREKDRVLKLGPVALVLTYLTQHKKVEGKGWFR